MVVPLLFFSAWLVRRNRGSIYRPFHWAALCSTFWMTWLVMWDHFPRDFFKYIAILAAIPILGAFLTWTIRSASRPRKATVVRRYREAYQKHRCPVCDFPILRGAFQQAVWTKQAPSWPANRLANRPQHATPARPARRGCLMHAKSAERSPSRCCRSAADAAQGAKKRSRLSKRRASNAGHPATV